MIDARSGEPTVDSGVGSTVDSDIDSPAGRGAGRVPSAADLRDDSRVTAPAEPSPPPAADAPGTGAIPLGRRAFLAGAAGTAAAVAIGSSAAAGSVPTGASYYEPLPEAFRLADTRPGFPNPTPAYQRINANLIRINVRGHAAIPSDAVAAVVSIAVIGNGQGGYVRATPGGGTSFVANVLLDPQDLGGAVTNLATVKLSADGFIDIYGSQPYHVIVDISGVYRSTASKRREGRLKHLAGVIRLADGVRVGHDETLRVLVPHVPSTATAVVVNLTVANAFGGGYATAYDLGGSKPTVSNVNFSTGETRGAGSIIKLGGSPGQRGFDVYTWAGGYVYADLSGYITGPGDEESEQGLFVPIEPVRLLDSRRRADVVLALGKRRLWPGWSRAFRIPSNAFGFPASGGVSGVAMNLTSVTAMGGGFMTVLPAQTPRAFVSNLNISRPGQTVANHVISQVSTAGVENYSSSGCDVVCDVAGWYVGSPQAATQNAPVDPPPPPAPLPWTLSVPGMFLNNNRVEGHSWPDYIVDQGKSWHWTNTGLVGDTAAIVAFGHRTAHGGPYRYQHWLNGDHRLHVTTPDQRFYTYRWVREDLTGSGASQILATSRIHGTATGAATFSLVACTGPRSGRVNDQPLGFVTYRIISTFALESWVDTSPTID